MVAATAQWDATAKQAVQMLLRDNGLMTGQVVLGGDPVRVSDITVPFLSVFGVRDLVGSADKRELRLEGGHVALVIGRTAAKTTVPTIFESARAKRAIDVRTASNGELASLDAVGIADALTS